MQASNSFHRFLFTAAAVAGLTLLSNSAGASEEFPAAIQEAAGMPCTPSCTLCHGVNPGTATTYGNKQLGKSLFLLGQVPPHGTAQLKAGYAKYAMDPLNSAAVAALKDGTDPETGDPLCGGPTYGCGAHVAKKAPPSNLAAPLWVVGAMVAGGLLRRRRTKIS